MVAGNAVGEQFARPIEAVNGQLSPSRGMIDPVACAGQSPLEGFGVLAGIMEQAGQSAPLTSAETLGKIPGQFSHTA